VHFYAHLKTQQAAWARAQGIADAQTEADHAWVLKPEFRELNLWHPSWWSLIAGKEHRWARALWDVIRRGNYFIFRGKVDHSLNDPFNFDEGQPGHAEARVLEDAGEARPFTIRHDFTEPSSALAELHPDGRFRLISARWGEERQSDSRSLGRPPRSLLGR